MSPRSRGRAGAAGLAIAGIAACVVDALGRDGIRAGSWAPEPLRLGALLLAPLLVGVLVPRRPRLAPGPSAATLALVLLALALVQLWRTAPAEKAPPLRALVVSDGHREDKELTLHALRTPARLRDSLGSASLHHVEVAGFLTVPETGAYTLEIDCGGACTLAVAGRVLISGEGHARAAAAIEAGVHTVFFALRTTVPRPYARFDWDRPVFLESARLGDAVSPTPLSPDLRGRERHALLRALLHWSLTTVALFLFCELAAAARGAWPGLPSRARAWLSERAHRVGLLAGAGAFVFLAVLHAWIAPRALPDGYLHAWTSEYMMQTVSVADLREEPLRSLVFNHIQPPLFDALRAVLVAAHPSAADLSLVTAVDHGLYACWAIAFALGAALTATWVTRLAGARAGAVAAALYAMHPATLFYATYLDSTFVSALGVLWVTYELFRMGPGGQGSATRLCIAVSALFLTRSIVQWPFVAVLLATLLLRGCHARRAMKMMAVLALVMGVFLLKQYALFGLVITSSFGPDSFCKGLWEYCPGTTAVDTPRMPPPQSASALRRPAKVNDEYNYNQLAFLRRSFSQLEEYEARLRDVAPAEIVRRLRRNLSKWLLPSSRHSAHVLVDALPWRGIFDRMMSGWVLVALVLGAGGRWLASSARDARAVRAGLGLSLPILYVAAVSIAFERNENMRYKFFVEPVLIVLLCAQAAVALRRWRQRSGAGGDGQADEQLDLADGDLVPITEARSLRHDYAIESGSIRAPAVVDECLAVRAQDDERMAARDGGVVHS